VTITVTITVTPAARRRRGRPGPAPATAVAASSAAPWAVSESAAVSSVAAFLSFAAFGLLEALAFIWRILINNNQLNWLSCCLLKELTCWGKL
jgi:hypothetical protein